VLSKPKIKLINSLLQKKQRDELGLFVAEGPKLILDLLPIFKCKILIATEEWLTNYTAIQAEEIIVIQAEEFKKISNLKTPQGVLAVFEKPNYEWSIERLTDNLSLALDDVQDPGNLGTILRIADWFGIQDVFCSEHCADSYSPKTVQATMGALARVRVHVVNLPEFLFKCKKTIPIYGTFLDGNDIYAEALTKNGIVVMGNEGNGISAEIEQVINYKLLIPSFPLGVPSSESLNVGVATALICGEFRRRVY
jgi:TrmH family RNA methyltransferase